MTFTNSLLHAYTLMATSASRSETEGPINTSLSSFVSL